MSFFPENNIGWMKRAIEGLLRSRDGYDHVVAKNMARISIQEICQTPEEVEDFRKWLRNTGLEI